MAVRYSIAHGRPPGELKRKGSTVTWCAWWTCEPGQGRPDAWGGARTREDVTKLVQRHAGDRGPLEKLPARACQLWRKTLVAEEAERAAQRHAEYLQRKKERAIADFEAFGQGAQNLHELVQRMQKAGRHVDWHDIVCGVYADTLNELLQAANGHRYHQRYETREWTFDFFGFTGAKPAWADLLGLPWPSFTAEDVARTFRAKAFDAHPDRGGSHEAFVALGEARRQAIGHLTLIGS